MIQYGVCLWCMDRRGIEGIDRLADLGLTCTQLEVKTEDDLRELSSPATQAAYVQAAGRRGVSITGLALNILAGSDAMLGGEGSPPSAGWRSTPWRRA